LEHSDADRPDTHHSRPLVSFKACPLDRVRADAEGLHQCKLVKAQPVASMQSIGWHHHSFTHSSVRMDAKALQRLAAVVPSCTACAAVTTGEIRFDGYTVAGTNVGNLGSNLQNHRTQFMTKNTRIAKERLVTTESVQVGATDAYPMNLDQHFGSCRGRGLRCICPDELARSFEDDGFHGRPFLDNRRLWFRICR